MIKDAIEDYKKSVHDKEENERNEVLCFKYDATARNQFKSTEWQDVRVGDIIKVKENEFIPADIILLNSPGPKGTAYVETKNLDGETNLKMKQVQKDLQKQYIREGLDTNVNEDLMT